MVRSAMLRCTGAGNGVCVTFCPKPMSAVTFKSREHDVFKDPRVAYQYKKSLVQNHARKKSMDDTCNSITYIICNSMDDLNVCRAAHVL